MSASAFIIDDGYTLEATIKETPGICPEMKFSYRPVTWAEQRRYFVLGQDPEKQEKFIDDLLTKKLVSWSFTPAISPEWIRKLRVALKSRIMDIILEYASSDEASADAKN